MNRELDRRTFLQRTGGLLAAGSIVEVLLAACGGNVATAPTPHAAPGFTPIASDGLKKAGLLQWGADYVSGAPYVFQDPTNPGKLVGFEVEIAQAMADLMRIDQKQIEVCYANLEQALQ